MKKSLLLAALLLPCSVAYADISISTDKMEVSKDCLKMDGDNIKIKSEDCDPEKGKGQMDGENRSVHGDDNPGQGHNKDKKDKKGNS